MSYSCLLNAYAKLGMGYEAQELSYYMHNNKDKDTLGFMPNEICYTTAHCIMIEANNNNDNANNKTKYSWS